MSSIHLFSCSTNSCLSLMNLVMFCALCHQAVTFFLLNNLNVIQNTNRGYQSKTGAFLYLPKGKFCQLIFCNEETRKPSDTDPSSNLALRMTLFPKKNKNGGAFKGCFCTVFVFLTFCRVQTFLMTACLQRSQSWNTFT